PLTQAAAEAAALKSADPLILEGDDQVSVTGCSSVAGPGYSCDLRLRPAQTNSVCRWSVVVRMTDNLPTVVNYSHVDCVG
ncbi:MAG: hypothetical protein ABR508_13065, partial [Candidatus Baltobacteraceae bacterium]